MLIIAFIYDLRFYHSEVFFADIKMTELIATTLTDTTQIKPLFRE